MPAPNSGSAALDQQILAEIVGGANPITASTVSVKVDGVAVTASATKQGDVTTVTYKPATPFTLKSTHKVEVTFTGGGSPVTRDWQFTTLVGLWGHRCGPGSCLPGAHAVGQ